MKNKDRYDLRDIDCGVSWMTNGCGRRIEQSRTITIYYKPNEHEQEEILMQKKTMEGLVNYLMNWLEEDDDC